MKAPLVAAALAVVLPMACLCFSTERQIGDGLTHYRMGVYDLAAKPSPR